MTINFVLFLFNYILFFAVITHVCLVCFVVLYFYTSLGPSTPTHTQTHFLAHRRINEGGKFASFFLLSPSSHVGWERSSASLCVLFFFFFGKLKMPSGCYQVFWGIFGFSPRCRYTCFSCILCQGLSCAASISLVSILVYLERSYWLCTPHPPQTTIFNTFPNTPERPQRDALAKTTPLPTVFITRI